jgi:hypothetical protein
MSRQPADEEESVVVGIDLGAKDEAVEMLCIPIYVDRLASARAWEITKACGLGDWNLPHHPLENELVDPETGAERQGPFGNVLGVTYRFEPVAAGMVI